MRNPRSIRNHIIDLLFITVGGAIFALAFDVFFDPNNIAPGGASGLAMVINRHFDFLPIGVIVLIINAPLFIMGLKVEGKAFLLKSLYGTVLCSVLIDLFSDIYHYTDDPLLAAVCGGVMMGAGLGVVLSRSASTGGSDIAAKLLAYKFPALSVGKLMLAVDCAIIALAAITFGHINYALYAVVAVYISTLVIDTILNGIDASRVAYVITRYTDEVVEAIDRELDRGATLLNGEGSYTGEPMKVVLVAIHRRQIVDLKRLVREIDPQSFVIITDAHEVVGNGFRGHFRKP